MKKKTIVTILCCVCAVLPIAAQTAAPEGMVFIPAGKFWMGRAHSFWRDTLDIVPRAKKDDRPANLISLDAFYIDKYEATNADYARFLEATGARPPWHWPQGKIPKGEERVAIFNVNWFEATAFCKWAGKRLPTEAEWEKAVRGGRDRKPYSWMDDDSIDPDQRVPAAISRGKAMAVGSFPPNGYGLYDMIGNVMEWTNDWYDLNYYAFMPKKNPQGPETGLYKSVRGGGWSEGVGEDGQLTNSYRNFSDPELRGFTIGFRCAKSESGFMRRLIISILITLLAAFELQAQQAPAKPVLNPNQLAMNWVDRLNALDDWHISDDGKEEGVDSVVDRMMELFTPDVLAEVPPHDEEQMGPVMLVGSGQVRKWVDKLARSHVKLNYIVKRQTEKEFEGELMVYSKPLPWGGLGISFQIIAAYSLRKDRRRFMEPGAVFIQFREDGKIQRFRLLLAEKDQVVD